MDEVWVLRLTHRAYRDQRMSTHVCLVARAFGARGIYIHGAIDRAMEKSLKEVEKGWGGGFSLRFVPSYRKVIEDWKGGGGLVIHLTMKGSHIDDVIEEIRSSTAPKLVVVGSKKVPGEVYDRADLNVAVGSQPHSEVSALAVFLDRLFKGRELHTGPDLKGASSTY